MESIIFGLLLLLIGGTIAAAVRYLWYWKVPDIGPHPEKGLLLLGHRGLPSRAPENTLPGFQAAVEAGLDGVELDVMETADGELVVSHNFDLERETDGVGYVHESLFENLARVNAAHRWADNYAAIPIPRLEDVLVALPEHVIINIELKTRPWYQPGFERKIVDMVRRYRLEKRAIISSFNPFSLLKVRWQAPELAIGYIWREDYKVPWYLRKPYLVHVVHPHFFHPRAYLVTPELIQMAHRHGMKVNVWTVNNRPTIDYLISLGADGIFTDFPELVTSVKGD